MVQNKPHPSKPPATHNDKAAAAPTPEEQPRKRGRPRAYDPETALAQAMAQFWDAGYAATSLDDLSTATGMNRPSLYGAFGDKKALYLKTLASYRQLGNVTMAQALSGDDSLAAALARVYGSAIDIYLSGPIAARGCYLIGTAATESVRDADIRDAFSAGLHDFDQQITARIRAAQKRGEISKKADAAVLGKLAIGVLTSLALRARAGEPRQALQEIADAGVRMICAAA